MDIDKPNESVKRWVAELRSLARRISSATPVSVAGRMTMLLALLFAVGLLGGLRIGESEIWLAPPLFTLVLAVLMLGALNTRLIAADHARMLWTLVVVFGAAFTVTFVVLPSSPPGGVRELLCKILPGCQPRHPATGYLAFFTLFLYLSALAGLARMTRDTSDSLPTDFDGDPKPKNSQP